MARRDKPLPREGRRLLVPLTDLPSDAVYMKPSRLGQFTLLFLAGIAGIGAVCGVVRALLLPLAGSMVGNLGTIAVGATLFVLLMRLMTGAFSVPVNGTPRKGLILSRHGVLLLEGKNRHLWIRISAIELEHNVSDVWHQGREVSFDHFGLSGRDQNGETRKINLIDYELQGAKLPGLYLENGELSREARGRLLTPKERWFAQLELWRETGRMEFLEKG